MGSLLPILLIGAVAGFITGTFTLAVGTVKNQYGLGMGGFWACFGAGLLLSFLGSTIAMMVFMWLMVRNSQQEQVNQMMAVAPSSGGNADALKQLQQMFVNGHITAQEYEAKRVSILSKM